MDELHGFRLELNNTEREALELLVTSNAVKNVGVGVGAVMKPVLDNLTVILAAVVAKEGFDFVSNKVDNWSRNAVDKKREYELSAYEAYVKNTKDDPIMTEEEYTENVTKKSYDYRAADWWQRNVGSRIRSIFGGN